MKKFRFFFAAMLVLFLAVGNSNAQNNKTTETGTYHWEGFMPCTDDYVTGEESYVITTWQSKVQFRYKGTYIGESGKHYTWSLIQNISWKNYVEGTAWNRTNIGRAVLKCDGVPIAISKVKFHITFNANDELVVRKNKSSGGWICL